MANEGLMSFSARVLVGGDADRLGRGGTVRASEGKGHKEGGGAPFLD